MPPRDAASRRPGAPPRWVFVLGEVGVAGALGAAGCAALDQIGLPERTGTGTVLAKEHRLPDRTYRTLIVNNRPLVVPQALGEQWVVALTLSDAPDPAVAAVERGLYERLREGHPVRVLYRRGRVSGTVQVLAVEP